MNHPTPFYHFLLLHITSDLKNIQNWGDTTARFICGDEVILLTNLRRWLSLYTTNVQMQFSTPGTRRSFRVQPPAGMG